ncbi:hypothetical protein Q7P37_000142 [Cladosporium fusiforme]
MSNIWTVVRDINRSDDTSKPEAHLNAVQTRNPPVTGQGSETAGPAGKSPPRNIAKVDVSSVRRPEDALQLLRSEPDISSLLSTLKRLAKVDGFEGGFNLHTPSPLSAQIINTIVSSIIPTFWPAFERQDRALITACVSSVAGQNSVIAKIQLIVQQRKSSKAQDSDQAVQSLFDVANELFSGDDRILQTLNGLRQSTTDKIKRDLGWKEYINLVGSGKVVNVLAEAEDLVRSDGTESARSPVASGHQYAAWLGRNIANGLNQKESEVSSEKYSALAMLFTRALSLGHPIPLVKALHGKVLKDSTPVTTESLSSLVLLLGSLQTFSKRRYLDHTLKWLSSIDLTTSKQDSSTTQQTIKVNAIASFLCSITKHDTVLQQHLVIMLSDAALVSSVSHVVIRASVATLAVDAPDELDGLVEKGLKSFGDQMFIKHGPILQQESLAQALLISAGYVHRRAPMALLMTARSSGHMQGVSNRLDASNTRARWLGMVMGTAFSSMVDKQGSMLNFGTDDMQSQDAKWYTGLINLDDKPSTLEDFLKLITEKSVERPRKEKATQPRNMPKIDGKPTFGPLRPPQKRQTEIEGDRIAEIIDTDEDDDELRSYAKPDSDAEDSDEDATLVNRDKTRPPVYIRDLMGMLRDTEKHDRFQLGIKHAATLIRRKTNFGREVSDHAEELARILSGLQDPFNTDSFDELRLQALIAVILSDASAIAPWLSRQAFAGEFSIAQRCVMLTALGLSGRELAGLKEQDGLNPDIPEASFPSKQLPPHLHALYSPSSSTTSTKRLEAAQRSLETSLLQPMALEAADKSTAHLNAVKVRTFSSRMAVERTKRKPAPNQLAKIFPEAYFYPLLNRYQQEITAYGSGSIWSTTPFLLVTLIKTLALLFHASGPATLNLSQLSADFWDFLLSLRVRAVGDITVLEALLFAVLTVLEINEDKQQIAQTYSKQLIETQQWADMVFERTGEGRLVQQEGQGEEAKVRTLAAAVLVKTGEVIEAHRKLLMGDMMGM